jgi:hypothetical protein
MKGLRIVETPSCFSRLEARLAPELFPTVILEDLNAFGRQMPHLRNSIFPNTDVIFPSLTTDLRIGNEWRG